LTTLWSATLTPGWDNPDRGALRRNKVPVQANDLIFLRALSRGDASCDSTVMFATYTFDRS
jgi:hypothetical protein